MRVAHRNDALLVGRALVERRVSRGPALPLSVEEQVAGSPQVTSIRLEQHRERVRVCVLDQLVDQSKHESAHGELEVAIAMRRRLEVDRWVGDTDVKYSTVLRNSPRPLASSCGTPWVEQSHVCSQWIPMSYMLTRWGPIFSSSCCEWRPRNEVGIDSSASGPALIGVSTLNDARRPNEYVQMSVLEQRCSRVRRTVRAAGPPAARCPSPSAGPASAGASECLVERQDAHEVHRATVVGVAPETPLVSLQRQEVSQMEDAAQRPTQVLEQQTHR